MTAPLSRLAATFQVQTNRLYRERDARLARGEPVVDLISGNVTEQGIRYPQAALERVLLDATRAARVYHPHPLGQPEAREAISAYYRSHGLAIPTNRIILTPGTSLAYWYAFSALCDPGDEILTPRPSYPLFDEIARVAGVRVTTYRLDESRDWAIELADLEARITPRTRAIVLVSPHHPTGAVASAAELATIAEIASRHALPIIVDEVFGEFLWGMDALPRPAETRAPLVITLNGFSKLFALPGIKLGWMALSGDEALVAPVLTALEALSDAFLPVNEIVQAAVPGIFREGQAFLREYRSEIARRRDATLQALAGAPTLRFVPPLGGFYVAVRVTSPVSSDDEDLALHLLRSTGCLVHPGFFYDLDPTHLVLSMVSDPETSRPALGRLIAALAGLT
ncbi:MAG: pyridoxal phosphate-dependent aminotransferase [Nitrospirae bacterium]|nr:pyridoxal phosphate-dependent aminotransferase [Nitrospirota bacterium]